MGFIFSSFSAIAETFTENAKETSPSAIILKQKELKYVFYPMGVGQYQNSHFIKAKFFLISQSVTLGTFFISPIFTGDFTNSIGKYSLYLLLGTYFLSLLDGYLFFEPGTSPVQPIASNNFFGLTVNMKF